MTYNFLKKIAISTIGIAMGSMIQTVPSLAASITIANPEFQDPVIKSGAARVITDTDLIPGWQLYDPSNLITGSLGPLGDYPSSYGVINNPLRAVYPSIPEGKNVAAIFLVDPVGSGIVGITQTLGDTLTANTKYTLQVDVHNPLDYADFGFTGFPGYEVELLAGGTVLAADNNTLSPQS